MNLIEKLDALPVDLPVAPMTLKDPNSGEPLGTLILGSVDHPKAREHQARIRREGAALTRRAGNINKAQAESLAEQMAMSPEERIARDVDALMARTLGWRNDGRDELFDGDPSGEMERATRNLYRTRRWAREQVETFLTKTENFTGSASPSSSRTSSTN